jgi:putative transposase
MKRIQLRTGLHFWLHGREYVIKERLAGGEFQICEFVTKALSKITYSAFIQFLFQGELEIQTTVTSGEKNNYIKADFTQIPESLRAEAKRRYCYISLVLELDVPQRNQAFLQPIIEEIKKQIDDPNPPSWLTLYRWLKTYEAAGKDIRSLIPKHFSKGDYRPKLHAEVIKIIEQAVQSTYLTRLKPDIADVYDEVLRLIIHENEQRVAIGIEALKIPHRSTIYRFVSKLEPSVIASSRYGSRIASQMYDPVMKGPCSTRPLERVEIDHTKLPLFVVDTSNRMPIGTPWLTTAVDKYSGITLGYYASFEPPSYLSVMQCLLHAIHPKNYVRAQYSSVENTWDTYGLPEVIVVDNGKEFYSTHFEDACLQLGIAIQYCPPKMPWYKSTIERYFGTLNSLLLSDKPGKNFSNLMKQYDYDPLKNAVVSFEALQEILHIFIVDIHNQSSHPSLKSPRHAVWSKAISEFPPTLPSSNQELKVLIGNITKRQITRHGVEFQGLLYNSHELARIRSSTSTKAKTTVKYDPTDLSRIYVFDSTIHQFLEVPALSQEYTKGMTLWQHQVVKRLASIEAEKVDIVALALAKEKIQKIVEQEWLSSKKGKTRVAMARWKGIGVPGINTEYIEEKPPEQIHTNIDIPAHESNVMAGISDIGSAFNNCPSSDHDNNQKTTEINLDDKKINSSGENASEKSTSKKQRNPLASKKSPASTINSLSDKVTDETLEWKPDLAGWDVSIGLPSL